MAEDTPKLTKVRDEWEKVRDAIIPDTEAPCSVRNYRAMFYCGVIACLNLQIEAQEECTNDEEFSGVMNDITEEVNLWLVDGQHKDRETNNEMVIPPMPSHGGHLN